MGIIEIIFIGIGLSMDAAAVCMTNGMVYDLKDRRKVAGMPLAFGFFQGLMPLLGYFAGGLFASFIQRYAGICVFLILGFIGGNMLWEGWHKEEDQCTPAAFTWKVLLLQAIATSIDAFGVGIGFTAMQVDILPTVCIIAATTFLCSCAAIAIGRKFGDLLGCKAEMLGGFILIAIGVKSLLGL